MAERLKSIAGLDQEPTMDQLHEQMAHRPTAEQAKELAARERRGVANTRLTGASQLTLKQSLFPCALVTILFFLWGFAYGLLDVMISHVQTALNVSASQSAGLSSAYFGAYFLGPLTFAGYVVRRFGFRWTFILGLVLYGVGAFMFWPSSVKESYGGLVASMFIVGSGLSALETASDPFLSICGPPRYSDIRLNFAQSFQAIGTVVAPLVGAAVFFSGGNSHDLTTVQWVYLGVGVFVFLLSIVFYFAPIPEVTDTDMADGEEQNVAYETGYTDKPLYKQYSLFWGVAAQFCYVGSQVAIANFFINFVVEVRGDPSQATASNLLAGAQAMFALGRFLSTGLLNFMKPRHVLWIFMTMIIVFICCAIGVKGNGGVACLMLVLFFESTCFPTIFTLSLRGLGRHTKRGGTFLVSSICGGAIFPPVLGAVADSRGFQTAMVIPLVGFVLAWSFPAYLNLTQAKRLDGYLVSELGIKPVERSDSADLQAGVVGGDEEKAIGTTAVETEHNKEDPIEKRAEEPSDSDKAEKEA